MDLTTRCSSTTSKKIQPELLFTILSKESQVGFTLVETLIALFTGLLIIVTVFSVFIASRQTYRIHEAISTLQENGRFIIEDLETRLRMAGYSGCYGDLSSGVEITLNNPANFAWDVSVPVQGYNNVSATQTIGGITGINAGTDVIVLKAMGDSVPLASNPDTATFTIAAGNNRFSPGELLLAADCERASLFQATSVTTASGVTTILHAAGGGTPGNSTGVISNRFGNDTEIGRLRTWMYYLQNGANGRTALFRRELTITGGTTAALQSIELTQNVDNMQILYGVDNDNDRNADVYRDASAVSTWRNVVSVRLALLLVSQEDNLINNKESYSFNTTTFSFDLDTTPAMTADRRIRRIFNAFGAIRNRTL